MSGLIPNRCFITKRSPLLSFIIQRASKGERLEVCVTTEEMNEAAWKYAYRSQIILDGTFGICDKRLLLFIVMGIDEHRRGVPLAFLIFSAPFAWKIPRQWLRVLLPHCNNRYRLEGTCSTPSINLGGIIGISC